MQTKSLVVILLLLVAGAAVWLVSRAGFAPDLPVAPSLADAPPAARVAADRTAERGELERPAGVAEAPVQRTLVPVSATGSGAATTFRVRGRLVDAEGAPRPAVAVKASTWPGIDELESAGIDNARADAVAAPESTTDQEGAFALHVPRGRDGSLSLHDDELVFAAEAPQFRSDHGDQDLGDVIAVRSGALHGVVTDERGQPVAGVKVEAALGVFAFQTRSSTMTRDDGTFAIGKLRPGKWQLRTASSRFMPTTLEVTLAAEERRSDLVVVVRPGNAIAGQVVDERGMGVAGLKVGSKRRELRGAMDIQRFSADEATTTDAAGFFTLAGLREGTATIRAFGPGHTSATAAEVAVGTGDLVLSVQRLAVIEGVLVTADGLPISGSQITAAVVAGAAADLQAVDDVPMMAPTRSATTGSKGAFRLESVTPGTVQLTARGKGHLPAQRSDLNVLPGQSLRGVRLIADAGATARVTVVDVDGKPVAEAQVRVARTPGNGASDLRMITQAVEAEATVPEFSFEDPTRLGVATTDGDGIAVLTGLPEGPAQFEAEHASFAAAQPVTATLPRAGTTVVRLQLQVPGFAEVHVVGVDGTDADGASLQVAATEARGHGARKSAITGSDGRVRVGPLKPGDYTAVLMRKNDAQRIGDAVFVFGDEEGALDASRQRFVVVAGETARVELRRPLLARLHGVVLGADGPVPDCSVELQRRGKGGFAFPGFGGRSVKTGPEGAFAFDEVEGGGYTLRFGKDRQLVKARQDVEVPTNVAEQRQDLMLRTGRVVVRVCEAGTGTPIEGAEIELESELPAGAERQQQSIMFAALTADGDGGEAVTMTIGTQRVQTDAQGVAEIDDVPAGGYTVQVQHKGHAAASKKQQLVVERQTTDCGRVELSAAGGIQGTVTAADGTSVPMALVQRRPVGAEAWSEAEPAMGGSYRLDALPPGRYAVRAQRPASGPARYGPEVEVEVKAGETAQADLRLPAP